MPPRPMPAAKRSSRRTGRTEKGCLVVDAVMPGMGGIALLEQLRAKNHGLPAIMITGHGDIAMAVQAMKAGAADFLEKPIRPDELLASIERALERSPGFGRSSLGLAQDGGRAYRRA